MDHIVKDAEDDLVQIVFRLEDDDWSGYATETLWAAHSGTHFDIQSFPFFVKEICFGDLVSADRLAGRLYSYTKTDRKSASSLYQIRCVFEMSELVDGLLAQLIQLSCEYELGELEAWRVISLHIPQSADADAVWKVLEEGISRTVWEVQEGDDRH